MLSIPHCGGNIMYPIAHTLVLEGTRRTEVHRVLGHKWHGMREGAYITDARHTFMQKCLRVSHRVCL